MTNFTKKILIVIFCSFALRFFSDNLIFHKQHYGMLMVMVLYQGLQH